MTKTNNQNLCLMDKRLEITYNDIYNVISLSRCCYTRPFVSLSLEEFKAADIFSLAVSENIHERLPGSESSCDLEKEFCHRILPEIKTVTVGISHACNLSCYHCFYARHTDSPFQKELYFDTLEKIKGHNLDVIHMQSSGEVFFYYFRLKKYLESLSLQDTKEVNFQTNGLLLSKGRIEELFKISKDTHIKFTFSFSVDAVTEQTYSKVRGGDFNKLLENISNTIEYFGRDAVAFSFTIKEPNKHEAAQFKDFIKSTFHYDYNPAYLSFDYFDKSCQEYFLNLEG